MRPPRKRQPGAAPRITLLGNFGTGNLGNDASLRVAVQQLRALVPAAHLAIACPAPDEIAATYQLPTFPIVPHRDWTARLGRPARMVLRPFVELVRWTSVMRHVRRADLVVVPGTGILDDFWESPFGMPYRMFTWVAVTRLARRRFEFVGIGAGPIQNQVSMRFFRAAARLASRCSYRDVWSRRYMASLGRDVSLDPVVPDLVLALRTEVPPAEADNTARRRRIGIGVMDYRGWNHGDDDEAIVGTYLDKLAAFARTWLDRGDEVKLFIGAVEDLPAAEALVDRLESSPAVAGRAGGLESRAELDYDGLIADLAEVDVMIATRYHNIVAALLASTPAISLGYAEKNKELLKEFGLAEHCQHIETFDTLRVIADTEAILRDRDRISASIAGDIARLSTLLEAEFSGLVGRLGAPTGS
jgi:polysaccharide pyruvyl transferase WcaK-like protein